MPRSSEVERLFDRYLGIPLLFGIRLLRRQRSLPPAPRRIGLIQPTAIGDLFLISGLLLHLRERLPDAEIHLFHGESNAAAIELLPVDVVPHCCAFRKPWRALQQLRRADLDFLIDCAPWARLTAALTALSGARATMGFHSAGQFIGGVFDLAVPYSSAQHEVENHKAMAEHFGPVGEYRLRAHLREPPLPIELPFSRLVLMHPMPGGSRARQKSWVPSHWAALARRLVDNGWIVGFTGAPGDVESVRPIVEAARVSPDRCVSLAGRFSLAQLAYVLARSRLLITVDTGVSHLATALDCAVIALHGPTRSERWGPRNGKSIGLDAPHRAAGYIHYGFERHALGNDIMASLSVGAVFEVAMSRLGRAVQPPGEVIVPAMGSVLQE